MAVSEGESGDFGWPETEVRQGAYMHGTGLQNGNPMEILPLYMYSIQ